MQKFKKKIYKLKKTLFSFEKRKDLITLLRQKNLLRIARNYMGLFLIDYPYRFLINLLKTLKIQLNLLKVFLINTKKNCRSLIFHLSKSYKRKIFRRRNYEPEEPVNFKNELKMGLENYRDNPSALNDFLVLIPQLFSKNYTFKPLSDLFNLTQNESNISIRVDIDAYPPSALNFAKHLASLNLPGSFFFLHSAGYYIKKEKNIFYRNPELNAWLLDIASLGMEIGLHNDVLDYARKMEVEAYDVLYKEINFIRNLGINIIGTVAHNSFPCHCAENFEVFQELQTFTSPLQSSYYSNYLGQIRKNYQIKSVSMIDLGLKYEGNYPCRRKTPVSDKHIKQILNTSETGINSKTWMDCYINYNPSFSRKYDCDIWLLPNKKWMLSDRKRNIFMHNISLNKIRNYLVDIKLPKTTVITIHPEYLMGA